MTLLLLLLLSRFSRVRLCATPYTAAHQAPPSLGFSKQEHWIHPVKCQGTKLDLLGPISQLAQLGYYRCWAGEGNGKPLQYCCLENPMDGGAWWATVHGVATSRLRLSDFTFTFHFHAMEKEMATQSSVLAWRIPGTAEPGGLLSIGSHRVGHDWSDLAAAAGVELFDTYMVWDIVRSRQVHKTVLSNHSNFIHVNVRSSKIYSYARC